MLDIFRRWIQFHELHVKSEPPEAPPINIQRFFTTFVERVRTKDSHKMLESGKAVIRITDIQERKADDLVVLLFQYADARVTAPTFMDLDSGYLRTEPLLDGEGVAVSAHAALSTRWKAKDDPRYSMLLEEVPGLMRSTVGPFLRSEFKVAAEGHLADWMHEASGRANQTYRPGADLSPMNGISLRDELGQGSIIQEIELFTHNQEVQLDEVPGLREVRRQIILKPTSQDGILDGIAAALEHHRRNGYTQYKIRYKNKGGKQKTSVMGATQSDIADTLLSRTEQITAEEPLAQCSESIVPSIANQMVALLIESRKGA